MRFIVDNQLPRLLATHLCQRGHDCKHVIDASLDAADDLTVWTYSQREQRVLISKDDDFLYLAARPRDAGRLVWVRLGNCRNTALIAAFDRVHDSLVLAFESGQRIVELR